MLVKNKNLKKLENRQDLSLLVHTFYGEIREDETLGPIFNGHISDSQWPEHLSKLTDFWESQLFGVAKFRGNPSQKHKSVDANLNYSITENHFEKWLQLWFETIDRLFDGEMASLAKEAARKMATAQYLIINKNRPIDKGNQA
jgi:hemoglobin